MMLFQPVPESWVEGREGAATCGHCGGCGGKNKQVYKKELLVNLALPSTFDLHSTPATHRSALRT